MDREMIVKCFEFCRVEDKCSTDCPYWDNNSNARECTKELAKDVLTLLKEQEPVKPNGTREAMSFAFNGMLTGYCPRCGTIVNSVGNSGACGKCGQKFDWE